MPSAKIKLKIADIIIALKSKQPLKKLTPGEEQSLSPERFESFFYKGSQKSDIFIDVEIVKELPQPQMAQSLFMTSHPDTKEENWQLLKKDNMYIYTFLLKGREKTMFINKALDKAKVFLLFNKKDGFFWNVTDIIYDCLQVHLINYFAQRKAGIFVHAVGIRDLNGKGLVFAGKSGSGKSTTARLWDRYSNATVLNDDRVIVRKVKGRFFIYGSPWHGDFSDYLTSRMKSAPLSKIFFIYHASRNTARKIFDRYAFSFLYPAVLPTFWDRLCLQNITSLCQDLVRTMPCFRMGFRKNKNVIKFVRNLSQDKI